MLSRTLLPLSACVLTVGTAMWFAFIARHGVTIIQSLGGM